MKNFIQRIKDFLFPPKIDTNAFFYRECMRLLDEMDKKCNVETMSEFYELKAQYMVAKHRYIKNK